MAPLYLVSACTSAEEFVAAFRRYADRTGIFVPMAEPLPAGKAGRLALTLQDGGVMIEGEAQVVTSSAKPQGLHGRAGMTIKFVEPDDFSKTVIAELEKARLAMKPAPPSVPPRPAQVPAEPRPVPPAVGGRIDAANALAECVVIGDAAQLRDGDPAISAANSSGALPKAAQKFVVPSIPTVPGVSPRPKTPTAPPETAAPKLEAPKADSAKAAVPTPIEAAKPDSAKVAAAKPEPPKKPARVTRIGMPAVDRLPIDKLTAKSEPVVASKPTALGMMPLKVTQTQPLPIASAVKEIASAPHAPEVAAPRVEARPARSKPPTTPPMPRNPTPVVPLPIARPPAAVAAGLAVEVPTESTDITTTPEAALDAPDTSEQPVEVAAPEIPSDAVPKQSRSGGMRASEIMAAIPTDDWTMSPDASAPVVLPPSQKIPGASSSAPVVVEAKLPPKGPPTGDWTMQADPNAPDGWAAPAKVQKSVERPLDVPAPTGKPQTGNPVLSVASDKAIQIQQWEDKPTGIGEPLVEIDSTLMEPLKPLPPDVLAPPVDADAPRTAGTPSEPPPLGPMPPRAPTVPPPLAPMFAPPPLAGHPAPGAPPPLAFASTLPPAAFGHATGPQQALAASYATGPQQALAGTYATGPQQPLPGPEQQAQMMGYPRMVTDGGTNFFVDSEQVPRYASDPTFAAADRQRRKRVLIVAVGSAVALVALVVAIVVITGGKKSAASPAAGSAIAKLEPGSAAPPPAGSGSQVVADPPPAPGSAGSAAATKPDIGSDSKPDDGPTVGPGTCKVEVTTTPAGAQISDDTKTLGTTPATFELPCGVEAKLTIRKTGFFTNQKTVKPGIDSKLEVALIKAIFSIKVTSMPAGATITVGGKSMGVTPTTIKLPAYTAATITVTKDGYAPDTQKLSPKQNNMAHHVNLKRVSGGRHR